MHHITMDELLFKIQQVWLNHWSFDKKKIYQKQSVLAQVNLC